MRVLGQIARSLPRLSLLAAVVLVAAFVLVAPPPVIAQREIDPRDIALTPADLPPGFSVDPAETGYERYEDGSLRYQVQMNREPTRENLLDGPILVQQIILRVGDAFGPGEGLAAIRDVLLASGFRPTSQGPNDAGTVSLTTSFPIQGTDVDVTVYSVGFVKDRFVIFTTWGGIEDLIDFPRLLGLAGVSSARLDAALGRR